MATHGNFTRRTKLEALSGVCGYGVGEDDDDDDENNVFDISFIHFPK